MEITKKQFLTAYNNHPPNKWVMFWFKYFSKSTEPKNSYVKKWTTRILLILFVLLMIGGIINVPMSIMIYPIIIYSLIIIGGGICMLTITLINNGRIKKIAKELGISIQEYTNLSILYIK
jgi:hypothetical protein